MSDPNQTEVPDWRRLLTKAERKAMLTDIARVSLAVGTKTLPEQPWSDLPVSGGPNAGLKSPIEQLGVIEQLLPSLVPALHQVVRSPLTGAQTVTQPARPERARRVTVGAWMAYARSSHTRRTLGETKTTLSVDTPENRAVTSFLNVLKGDCRTLALLADLEEEAEAAERANNCLQQIERIAGSGVWPEIKLMHSAWTRPPTQREVLRPDYAYVSRARAHYRQECCFDWDQPLLTLPPRESWRLYEVWCLLTVYRALVEIGWQPILPSEFFAIRTGRLTLGLATGERSRVLLRSAAGRMLSLTYNQAFAEGRESLSHTMQPDITLSDGERIWILDAKFKLYAEPGEEGGDINQMHAYRDAIVDQRASRAVASAWCLYAGATEADNRAQIAYERGPDAPVGALCLRPGDIGTFNGLRALLHRWLS